MSEITLFGEGAVPSFARNVTPSGLTASLAGGSGASSIKRISIKGGVFRLYADGKEVAAVEDRHLDIVVVAATPNVGRVFYAAKYEEGVALAPACWSDDGITPSASSSERQSDKCASCPQNIAGSGANNTRACRYQQRLAVKLANDIERGDILQLTLPATSIFGKAEGDKMGLQAYARYLSAQNCEVNMVVTRMRFDTAAATPKLVFRAQRWLNDGEYAIVQQDGDSSEAKQATTMTVAQVDKVPPLPQRPAFAAVADEAAPAKKPRGRSVVADEEEVQEPVKRASATAAAPQAPTKSRLADIAAEWDED